MEAELQVKEEKYLLKCEHVIGQYRGLFGVIQPVNDVSLTVRSGDIIGIVGESGCGKSTFGELLTGSPRDILYFVSGSIKILAYVPQSSLESLNPVKRIRDFILDVIKQRTGKIGDKGEVFKMAKEHFKRLGLDGNVIDRFPHELSGGMRQIVNSR